MDVNRLFSMMDVMSNPEAYIFKQKVRQNPEMVNKARELLGSCQNRKQKIKAIRKIFEGNGMDLEATARKYGIAL